MKLTAIILLAACLQVSANGFSQKVSLSVNGAPLDKVFREIKKQTGYSFIYTDRMMREAKMISVNIKDVSLEQALDMCLKEQPLSWAIIDKTVIIQPKGKLMEELPPPPIDIKGRVVDENGEPVLASINVKGTNIIVATNESGYFELKNVAEDAILKIGGVNFDPVEIKVNGKTDLTIAVKMSVKSLDETIVKGYYKTTRRLNTGSVSKVDAVTISKQPVSNPLQALQGRVTGMQINQSTGMPGGGFSVKIRGRNSLSSGNSPLYIVDGVPFSSKTLSSDLATQIVADASPLNSINPAEIESIEILKDADATAIYGSRGANGVVLITTKKGKPGKTKVMVDYYRGTGVASRRLDVLNTQQYREMRKEAFKNDGIIPTANNAPDLFEWDSTKNTDWQEKLIGGTANYNNLQASVSGGNANTQFLMGGGFYKETTVFPGDFGDQKSSGHFSINHISDNKKFTSSLSTHYMVDNNNLVKYDPTATAISMVPNAPDFLSSDGGLLFPAGLSNPYNDLNLKYSTTTHNIISNGVLGYQILPGLNIKGNFGFTNTRRDELQVNPVLDPSNTTLPSSGFANSSINTWIVEPQISWNKQIGKNQFNVLAGATFQEDISKNQYLEARGFSNNTLLENIQAATSIRVRALNYTQYKYNAFFGRVNLNRSDKYLLNFTARRDGSSRFGQDKLFSNFGAAGAAWIFSKEKEVQQFIPFLSFGKLRGSYGITGNDQIVDYQSMDIWSVTSYPYQAISGLYPTQLVNPDYAWEKNKKAELALELGFFNDRILLTSAWYHNRSSNQLIGTNLAPSTGFTRIQANSPATVQNKGFELELITSNIKSNRFTWSTSFNLTVPRNKLISYPNLAGSSRRDEYEIGRSLDLFKAWHLLGVDPQTGVFKFEDVNNDGVLSSPNDLQAIKERTQKFYGGLQNSFEFEGFQLDIFFQFVKQTQNNYLTSFTPAGWLMSNQPALVMNRWQRPGDVTEIQKFTAQAGSQAWLQHFIYSNNFGDNRISDASFVRLKNLALSYNLPERLTKKMKIKNSKIYLQGQNLLTFTDFVGMDPENGNILSLPQLRVLTAGIQITL